MANLLPNAFKHALAAGTPQIGLWLTLESPLATEIAAHAGFDWMLLDMEHTGVTLAQIGHHVVAARGGSAELVVRVPSIDPVLTKQLLDGGVRNLMFPFVQTAEEAALCVAATRYPPDGFRGVSGSMRANNFGRIKDYLAGYADTQTVIVQVENPKGLNVIAAMGEVTGLDAIFIGPNDLAANMGFLGQTGAPEVKAAIADALGRIRASGKAAGLLNYDPADARASFAAGFGFIAVGSDSSSLIRRLDALRAEFPS